MAEGLFDPRRAHPPGLAADDLIAAMVRVVPRTTLVLDLAGDEAQAQARARNEALADGSERWYRWFTAADVARARDPVFAMGMVRHEFAQAVRRGDRFPTTVALDGGGSGFAVSARGHVVTNFHLVTSEVANHGRDAGAVGVEVRCRTLAAQVARRDDGGGWRWQPADAVWLVSNPPTERAIRTGADGRGHLADDVALLRVDPAPLHFLQPASRRAHVGQAAWLAGFPLRTARDAQRLREVGYRDADGSLRVSTGRVTAVDGDATVTTDADGSMGSSGSALLDRRGDVVGVFSRTTGDGPRNAFAYGHVGRVAVATARIAATLGWSAQDRAADG